MSTLLSLTATCWSIFFILQQTHVCNVMGFTAFATPSHLYQKTKHCLHHSQPNDEQDQPVKDDDVDATILFPVLHKIDGISWEGRCRYAGADLRPAPFVLTGGTQYDLSGTMCMLRSFLTFPNGKTRRVVMRGRKQSSDNNSVIRLDPVDEDGPIYMLISELEPDTVLINEIDRLSGNIVMTASLSIVNEGEELVQIAHEVGGDDGPTIEGHQVWRLKRAPSTSSATTTIEEELDSFQ